MKKRKKIIAAMMTLAVVVNVALPGGISSVQAAENSRAAENITAQGEPWGTTALPTWQVNKKTNVEDIKFTHNEWTGKTVDGVENVKVMGVNREEDTVSSIPY